MSQSSSSGPDLKQTVEQMVEMFNDPPRRQEYLDMHADDVILHGLPEMFSPDKEGLTQFYGVFFHAFPGVTATAEHLIAEGDRIAVFIRLRGVNEGDFMGMPPSGKAIDVRGVSMLRFANGKIAERLMVFDQMTMLQQLGVVPAAAPAQ